MTANLNRTRLTGNQSTRISLDQSPDDAALLSEDADKFSPSEDICAKVCRWCVHLIVVGLIVMMGFEMLARSVFGWSIQVSNEIGGYALVAVTFLSLASGQLLHAYHRVHFLDHHLSSSARALVRLLFDSISFVITLVLLYEVGRFEWLTWESGDVAATTLMTPLWLPRLTMLVGMLGLLAALARTLAADYRRLQAARSDLKRHGRKVEACHGR